MINLKDFTEFCYESENKTPSAKDRAETIRKKRKKMYDDHIERIKKMHTKYVNGPSTYNE